MSKKHPEPKTVKPEDIDPGHDWNRPLMALGQMAVDFEERVDFRRLHRYRLGRTRQALAKSGLGAILTFDQHNIRYISSTVIGEWARDKMTRYCLLTGPGDPYVWDFGSAKAGLFRKAADEIRAILEAEGVADMLLGVDMAELPMLFELQRLGIDVRDGQQMMLDVIEQVHDHFSAAVGDVVDEHAPRPVRIGTRRMKKSVS